MKNVFASNHELAIAWVLQLQSHGRTSTDNFSFSGPDLYSYLANIARLVETPRGDVVALFSTERWLVPGTDQYSRTTPSKHMPPAMRAVWHYHIRDFHVPSLAATPDASRDAMSVTLDRMIADVASARTKDGREQRRGWVFNYANTCNEFCEAFGLARFYVVDSAGLGLEFDTRPMEVIPEDYHVL